LTCPNLPSHGDYYYTLGIIGKPLMNVGASTWFHDVLKYNGEVIEY